jgi:hypothetical protein
MFQFQPKSAIAGCPKFSLAPKTKNSNCVARHNYLVEKPATKRGRNSKLDHVPISVNGRNDNGKLEHVPVSPGVQKNVELDHVPVSANPGARRRLSSPAWL